MPTREVRSFKSADPQRPRDHLDRHPFPPGATGVSQPNPPTVTTSLPRLNTAEPEDSSERVSFSPVATGGGNDARDNPSGDQNDKSRVTRDCCAQFRESLGLRCPQLLDNLCHLGRSEGKCLRSGPAPDGRRVGLHLAVRGMICLATARFLGNTARPTGKRARKERITRSVRCSPTRS